MITMTRLQEVHYSDPVPTDQEWARHRAVVQAGEDATNAADRAQAAVEQLVRDLRAQGVPWSQMSTRLGLTVSRLRWLETAYLRRQDRERNT